MEGADAEADPTHGQIGARDLLASMEILRAIPQPERHAELSAWARSGWWHPLLMKCEGWQGKLARQAWRALKRDLEADTPARAWDAADAAVGRASINRLLGVEGVPGVSYATAPFRTLEYEGRSWIAGAVCPPPFLDSVALQYWRHLDVADVVLWDPRTGETRIAGEHHSVAAMILPDDQGDELDVYGTGEAFFRAWAAKRADRVMLVLRKAIKWWVHPIEEPADGDLPGALIVGPVEDLRWRGVTAGAITARAGVVAADLHRAALRAARLPQFVEGGIARG